MGRWVARWLRNRWAADGLYISNYAPTGQRSGVAYPHAQSDNRPVGPADIRISQTGPCDKGFLIAPKALSDLDHVDAATKTAGNIGAAQDPDEYTKCSSDVGVAHNLD